MAICDDAGIIISLFIYTQEHKLLFSCMLTKSIAYIKFIKQCQGIYEFFLGAQITFRYGFFHGYSYGFTQEKMFVMSKALQF